MGIHEGWRFEVLVVSPPHIESVRSIDTLRRSGFTLVEIMIVVAIIGLIAMIAIPSFVSARERSQDEVCNNNKRVINEQLNIYCLERGCPCTTDIFPNLCAVRDALVPVGASMGEKYIKNRKVFACPGNVDQTVEHDYGFLRDGRRITGFLCNIIPDHND